jgi:hypothetical protein
MTDAYYTNPDVFGADGGSPQPLTGPGGYGLPPNPNEYLQSGNRPSSEWGKPDIHMDRASAYPGVDPSPYMPRPGMFRGIMSSIARVPWSMNSTRSGTAMLYYWNAYYKQKQTNQLFAARLSLENAKLAQQQFAFNNSKEMSAAHDALTALKGMHKDTDERAVRAAFQDYRNKFNDPTVDMILNNSGNPYSALEALFNDRDTTLLNVNKAISQRGKSGEDDSLLGPEVGGDQTQQPDQIQQPSQPAAPTTAPSPDTTAPTPISGAPGTITPHPATVSGRAASRPAGPGITPPAPAATAPPAPTTAPGATAPPASTPAATNPPPIADDMYGIPSSVYGGTQPDSDLSGLPRAPQGVYNDARTQLAGTESSIPTKMTKARAQSAAIYGDLRQKIIATANDPKLNAQQALKRFYALDSGSAEWARQIANNDKPMPGATGFSGARMSATAEMLGQMVHKLNPNWEGTQYKFKQEFISPNGKTQQAFTSADRLNSTAIRLKQAIDQWRRVAGPDATIPQAVLTRMGTNLFGTNAEDAPFKALNAAWLAFSRESVRVQNMGNPEVTPPLQITDLVSGAPTPWAMYGILSTEANADVGAYEASNDNWKGNMKTTSDAPGYQADKYAVLKALGSDLQGSGRITGRVPKSLVPYSYPDLPTQHDRDAVTWAYDHPNDPTAKRIFHDYHIDQ